MMKKIMTGLQQVFLIALLAGAAGCSKSNGTGGPGTDNKYFARFKINGEQKEYKGRSSGASIAYQAADGVYQLGLAIFKNDNSPETSEMISIALYNRAAFTAGTTCQATDTLKISGLDWPKASMTFSYNPSVSSFITVPNTMVSLFPHLLLDCTVTITELGTDHIKGTFSSHVYDDFTENAAEHIKYLTEGEFYLPKF
jgi:hypothetical protein